jgi:hypothetical protein
MGRPRKEVCSYLLHKASGQARVRINGRDIYLGRYGSAESKEAYARLVGENLAHGGGCGIIVADGETLSVAALVVKYVEFARSYYVVSVVEGTIFDFDRSGRRVVSGAVEFGASS